MYVKKPITADVHMDVLPNLLKHLPRLKDQLVCDFCGDVNPIYIYAALRTSTGRRFPCWRWCACKSCSVAVEAKDWKGLKERVRPVLMKLLANRGVSAHQHAVEHSLDEIVQTFQEDAIFISSDEGEEGGAK